MRKKILITGASGFIGSFLVEEALRQEYEVYAGVRPSSNRQFLQDPAIRFAELSFSDPVVLKQQLVHLAGEGHRFDYVVHNAGITQEKRNETFQQTNFQNTKHFADALQASGMMLQKFILVSSLASFGPGHAGEMRPIRLSDEKKPMSLYGRSKLQAEAYIAGLPGFPYLVINPTAVYGPRDKAFLQFVKLIRSGWEPYVGRHRQMISMIYVKDLAKAIISLAASDAVNRSFIVSDGREYDKEQMGEITKAYLNKKTLKVKLPLSVMRFAAGTVDTVHKAVTGYTPFLSKEKIDEISQPNWLCDSSDVWSAINDKPQYFLKEGLEETIEWYREQKWL